MTYEIIKARREKYEISQIKLAEKAQLSPALISSFELKKTSPTEKQLAILSNALNELTYAIDYEGLNIKKKKIQTNIVTKNKLPKYLKSIEDYKNGIKNSHFQNTVYKDLLEKLYSDFSKRTKVEAPKAISLFSGCGGLDFGFKACGFNLVGHVELEDFARKIYEINYPESNLLGTDICSITNNEILDWKKKFGTIDIIIGGPPCQGFSLAGKRDPSDIRNQLYKYYVNIVSKIQPKVFVMENVRLLTSMKNEKGELFIDNIKRDFENAGYRLIINEINASDYGIPQSRERLIIVGVNKNFLPDYSFPKPMFSQEENRDLFTETKKYRTFRDATRDLPSLESGEKSTDPLHWAINHPEHVIRWLKNVPEGCSAHDNKDASLRPPSGFNTTYKRIKWDEPCSTISTNFSMISGCRNVHPSSTRSLTIREACRCQSFPDEFIFIGNWGDIRKVIGNAVPPLLSYIIANSIMEQLF
ncbi:MAG: DNA (cytosine-5-)-methyltransferase [Spirochaetaceae bacterium]|nr:DNA (cytosine-5-)-methyltransferase [Spirochaetaceae bacterium]